MNNTEDTLKKIHEALAFHTNENKATAYGLTMVDDQITVKLLSSNADIYDLIDNMSDDRLGLDQDYMSFISYGWAAPLNKNGEVDGAPSEHPKRRRVKLIASVSPKSKSIIGSSVEFLHEENEEIVYDEGTATGSLADALLSLVM